MNINDYECVIGLEVHVELKTETKIFCGCSTAFGAEPNTQCCPVCTGMPGTLPVLNKKVIEYAVKAGIATDCTIAKLSKEDRKNYFYPDLPKAYQISQFDLPLCAKGHIDIETPDGAKRIGITRIHIEEDAGKLIHDDKKGTLIDCNRCGVPLIEIVSEPDMRSASEALAYLKKLKSIMECAGVSDCRMNEGSLRCDVNLSVRKKGETALGTRTEMKNLNSFKFIQKAIEYEFRRQSEEVDKGGKIVQETRRYDQATGKTESMRSKENADDYRYFPDPDLPLIKLGDDEVKRIAGDIPELPNARKLRFMKVFGLAAYDAEMLISETSVAAFYEKAAVKTQYPKLLVNLIIGEILKLLPQDATEPDYKASPEQLAKIAEMLGNGEINSGTAKKVLHEVWENGAEPETYVSENNLAQINSEEILGRIVDEAVRADPKSVSDYKKGKTAAFKALMGKIMAKTSGRGNPEILTKLLEERLGRE